MKYLKFFFMTIVIGTISVFFLYKNKTDKYFQEETKVITSNSIIKRNENLTIGGWLVRWGGGKGLVDVLDHINVFTTLSPFSYEVTHTGNVSDVLKLTTPQWKNVLSEAKKNNVTIIPSFLWMDTEAMTSVLQNETKRNSLSKQIADTITTINVDGADIDFEWMNNSDHSAFIIFLKDLKTQLHGKLLTCSIEAKLPSIYPDEKQSLDAYYKELGSVCDEVRIMAYDMRFSDPILAKKESAPYIPSADVRTVSDSVEYIATSIPREKIVLGIALYGYEYEVTEHATSTSYRLLWSFSPSYVKDVIAKNSLQVKYGESGEAYVTYQGSKNQTPSKSFSITEPFITESEPKEPKAKYNVIWWSDKQAVENKIELAKALGLKGISLFRLDGDIDQSIWNVLGK
ncbi:MAG: glycosyl hydrolase family 18 protein [Candidatus Roizmanbacteria bacterium]